MQCSNSKYILELIFDFKVIYTYCLFNTQIHRESVYKKCIHSEMRENKCLHPQQCLVLCIRDEKMASKKTKVVCGRVPHNVVKEMEMHDLNVQEAVQIALKSKRDPNVLYKAELRSLLSEQEILASRLARVNLDIEDIKKKLNINKSDDELKDELFVDDNMRTIQTTLDRFERKMEGSSLTIQDFAETIEGKRIIDVQLSKTDLTREDFMVMLFEKHDKSIQTKLDS